MAVLLGSFISMQPISLVHYRCRRLCVFIVLTMHLCQVDGNKVRLFGVDAPETKQSCRAADGSQYLCGETISQL